MKRALLFQSLVSGWRRLRSSPKLRSTSRRLLLEQLDARRALAADLISILPISGSIPSPPAERSIPDGWRNEMSVGVPGAALAGRMTNWVTTQLGVDVADLPGATLREATQLRDTLGDIPAYTLSWEGMEWDFLDHGDRMEFVDVEPHEFHNNDRPWDTTGDGDITPLDALTIVNFINEAPVLMLPNRMPEELRSLRIDVTADRWVTPQDALIVVNWLNYGDRGSPDTGDDGGGANGIPPVENGGGDNSSMPERPPYRWDWDGRALAEPDYVSQMISASYTTLPAVDVDVLSNDLGEGLQIVSFTPSESSTVELLVGAGEAGRDLLRYTPGEGAANYSGFSYVIRDTDGNESETWVNINYYVDPSEIGSLSVTAPPTIEGAAPGETIPLYSASGSGLIQVSYDGPLNATFGVLISFAPADPPFGVSVPGTLSTNVAMTEGAGFYPELAGGAWITGTLEQVNQILAGLDYTPATGFSAPDGIGLRVDAYLYGSIVNAHAHASGSSNVIVPADPLAPKTVGDYFEFDPAGKPVRLDVLSNDTSVDGSPLTLVSIEPATGYYSIYKSEQESRMTIDRETNEVIYLPPRYPIYSYETFVYVVADQAGRVAQGRMAFTVTGGEVFYWKID